MIWYIKFCVIITLSFLFWCGIYDNVMTIYPNTCEMTYMFEYPKYKEIKIESNHSNNYSLYVYGEGHYFQQLVKENFRGIPALFIPGNQGSFRQVRSLASVAYKKSQETYNFHFNYFAIDFNEESGALFGPVLQQQMQFVGLAIQSIMQLYKHSPQKPKSVVLVGHSIGGLIARAVVGLEEVPPEWVSMIITLATPHTRPVIIPDSYLLSFYEKVNYQWAKKRESSLKDIAFVTIGGGKNDIQVPTAFTTSPMADVDETLLSVPTCWLTTDHLAIVWCKQLVLALTRALFESVDESTLLIVRSKSDIVRAFRRHISEKSIDFEPYNALQKRIQKKIKRKENLLEVNSLQQTEKLKATTKHKVLAIPLISDHQRQHLSIVFRGSMDDFGIVVCEANTTNGLLTILNGENLQRYVRVIPRNRKEVNIDMSAFEGRGFTHIITFIQPSGPQAVVEIDFSDAASRRSSTDVPLFASSFAPHSVMDSTPPKAATVNITLREFTEMWQSFTLFLNPVGSCPAEEDHPIVSFRTSWTNRWEFLPSIARHKFNMKVDIPSPEVGEGLVEVHIVKSSICAYSISLEKNLRGTFENIALTYASHIPAFITCHLLLVLSRKYKDIFNEKKSYFTHLVGLSPVAVIPFTKFSSFLLGKISDIETELSFSEKNRIHIEAIPLVMFLCTLPLTLLLVTSLRIITAGISQGIYLCLSRTTVAMQGNSSLKNDSQLLIVSSFVAVLLISVGAATCGVLPIFIAAILYFMKIVKMYVSLLQYKKSRSSEHDSMKLQIDSQTALVEFHFIMLTLLLLSVSVLNLPTLITWAKSRGARESPIPDPSFTACVVVLSSLAILWQVNTLRPPKKYYKHIGYIIHASSIMVILFGTVHLFRVSEIVSCTLLIIALHQLFSPKERE